ncbi:MAG: hypothetical protein NZ578_01705 [Candidatus Binatia bacterium]|nr:hypothetical protein [Candidatus Binatia bacterium]
MATDIPRDVIQTALATLAREDIPAELVAALDADLARATAVVEEKHLSLYAHGRVLARVTPYGSLSFFLPPSLPDKVPRRLATYDRRGRLLLLLTWDAQGKVARVKVRNVDGRFLGVVCRAASHLGWGQSDCVWLLAGESGFLLDRSLTFFRSVAYENLDCLPPLDDPTRLPCGGGSTILNVLALLAQDQGKEALRYRGPYPSERLFATLRESFRCSGELGVARECFTRGAEEAAVQLRMVEPAVDWFPAPHERFFPAAHTCVQLRDGVEKVYDRGRLYYRPDVSVHAYTVRREYCGSGQSRYIAGLSFLGRPLEDHLVLDEQGEILERSGPASPTLLRGPTRLSDDWKAALVRLIAAESTPLLQAELWPTMAQLRLEWGETAGALWRLDGNTVVLHAGMVRVYRDGLERIRSASEGLFLAARFASEVARVLGPFVRQRAQDRLASLSPAEQQVALFLAAPVGLPDAELRAFLTRLAMGEELPTVG